MTLNVKDASGATVAVKTTTVGGEHAQYLFSQPAGTIGDGRTVVTTAGTRVQLSASSVACQEVIVTAELDNSGIVVVGGNTCVAALSTRRGTPLAAGDVMVLEVSNLNLPWLDSTVSGDGVTYTFVAA